MTDNIQLYVYTRWIAYRFGSLSWKEFFASLDELIISCNAPPSWLLDLSGAEREYPDAVSRKIEMAITAHTNNGFALQSASLAYKAGHMNLDQAEEFIASALVDDEYGVPQTSDPEMDSAFSAFYGHAASLTRDEYLNIVRRRLSSLAEHSDP